MRPSFAETALHVRVLDRIQRWIRQAASPVNPADPRRLHHLALWLAADVILIAAVSVSLIALSQRAIAESHQPGLFAAAMTAAPRLSPAVGTGPDSLAGVRPGIEPIGYGELDDSRLPVTTLDAVSVGASASNSTTLPFRTVAWDSLQRLESRALTLYDIEPRLESSGADSRGRESLTPRTWVPALPAAPGWSEGGLCALHDITGPVGANNLIWPADSHSVSGYSYSGWHFGIDVTAPYGAPIYATDSGVVVVAGWNNSGYGTFLVVDHGNGLWSAYAHLSQVVVGCLESVMQGQLIGMAGATGYASGSHLHFELYQTGQGQINPWPRLP